MKSARINFGIPESEYILEVDDSGAATSQVNQDTGDEYVGAGNYSETYEGTGNALFGNDGLSAYTTEEQFLADVVNGNIYVVIDFDLTSLTGVHLILPLYCDIDALIATNITVNPDGTTVDGASALFGIVEGDEFNLNVANFAGVINGVITDVSSYAPTIPTRTTIYYHPMPE